MDSELSKKPDLGRHPIGRRVGAIAVCVGYLMLLQGCVTQAPSIAHVHVGHAITGASDTPGNVGYFQVAETAAEEAQQLATRAADTTAPITAVRAALGSLNEVVSTRDTYPLSAAITEARSHIEFAANSDDASANVKAGARAFAAAIEGVLYRSDLIKLYATDALASDSESETRELAAEIARLAQANVRGEDLDGDGVVGTTARENGVQQLRASLDAMVARENPPYTTVDRWYLFNLIRLPSGDWAFRKSGSGGARGY